MVEPILDPGYWKSRYERVIRVGWPLQYSIYHGCVPDTWEAIASNHRLEIAKYIGPNESVLDVGCGWGRLAYLMPTTWRGSYLGIDLSPTFISLAKENHPDLEFQCMPVEHLDDLYTKGYEFDWAVLISFKQMVINNLEIETWNEYETTIKKVAKKILVLEYAEDNKGEVL